MEKKVEATVQLDNVNLVIAFNIHCQAQRSHYASFKLSNP